MNWVKKYCLQHKNDISGIVLVPNFLMLIMQTIVGRRNKNQRFLGEVQAAKVNQKYFILKKIII